MADMYHILILLSKKGFSLIIQWMDKEESSIATVNIISGKWEIIFHVLVKKEFYFNQMLHFLRLLEAIHLNKSCILGSDEVSENNKNIK